MFKLSKSTDIDFENSKKDVQHKVLCDWLRNIQQQNIQLARKITLLTNLITDQLSSPLEEPDVPDLDDK